MKVERKGMCVTLDDYFDGELGTDESRRFEEHLEICRDCKRRLDELSLLRNSMGRELSGELGNDADLRIRRKIRESEEKTVTSPEIMDLEDVARLLRIPVHDAIDLLDQLPSFEVGGRLRFRRNRIMEWIEHAERKLLQDRQESVLRQSRKIIKFSGGMP